MAEPIDVRPAGSYGIDAPRLIVVPVVLIAAGIAQAVLQRSPWPVVGVVLIATCCALGWYASRIGKFVVWGRLLDGLGLRGDEQILDLGPGRGALLVSAAKRLPTGRVVGVDLWRSDQSGNSAAATTANAAAAGVADRIELHTASIVALPFPDGTFDVVLSNLVLHNLHTRGERDTAIDEAYRVLRPGGRLLIGDLRNTRAYRLRLERLGASDVDRRSLGWRQWWTGPWLQTRLVTARKPA